MIWLLKVLVWLLLNKMSGECCCVLKVLMVWLCNWNWFFNRKLFWKRKNNEWVIELDVDGWYVGVIWRVGLGCFVIVLGNVWGSGEGDYLYWF